MINKNPSSLLNSTLIYSFGSVISKFFVFLLLPLFSFFLNKESLGVYDILLTSVSFLVPIFSLEISSGLYKYLISEETDNLQKKVYFSTSFFTFLVSSVVFFTIVFVINQFLKLNYFYYGITMVFSASTLAYFLKAVRGLGNIRFFSKINVLNAFFLLLFNILFLNFWNDKLEGIFIATIIANLTTVIYVFCKLGFWNFLSVRFVKKDILIKMLLFSVPLIPNVLSWWLVNMSDKFIVLNRLGADFNGVYAISSRFPGLLIYINSIFILAWQDKSLSSKEDNKNQIFNEKLFKNYIKFQFSLVLILIAFSEIIINLVVDEDFLSSFKYMGFIYVGVAFSALSSYYGAIFLKENKTKEILISSVLAGVINLLFCLLMIDEIGLFAPALGTLISYIVMFSVRHYILKKTYNIDASIKWLSIFTILGIIYSILILVENIYVKIFLMISSLCIGAYFNKNNFTKIVNKIK